MLNPAISVRSPGVSFHLALLTELLQDGSSIDTRKNYVSQQWGDASLVLQQDASLTDPACAVYLTPSALVVTFLGAVNNTLRARAALGWLGYRSDRTDQGLHPAAEQTVSRLLAESNWIGVTMPNRIYIAGHSWGGACGLALASRWMRESRTRSISVATFGTPKVADDRGVQALEGIDICRWMNSGDAIGICPPTPNKTPLLYALLTPNESDNVQQFEQIGWGEILYSDGPWIPGMFPSIPGTFVELDLLSWITSNDSELRMEHSLTTYRRRLSDVFPWNVAELGDAQLVVNVPLPQPQERQRALPNPENQVEPVLQRALRVVDGNVVVVPQRDPAMFQDLGPTPVYVGEKPPYVYVRVNGTHTVQSLNTVVCVTSTAKGARSLAKSLNGAWSKWNSSLIGDPAALEYTVEENFLE